MRLIIGLLVIALGGCSTVEVELPVVPANIAPSQSGAMVGAKKAANEAGLVGIVEISEARKAYSSDAYFLCLRGANPRIGTRHYAVFFKNEDYVSVRSSVINEECESQSFAPLGTSPFSLEPDKPKS